jgi:hypothetical protein
MYRTSLSTWIAKTPLLAGESFFHFSYNHGQGDMMKQYFLTLGLIAILLLNGCSFALSTLEPVSSPQAATPTPNIMPRLDPSPTPSGSTLPLTCQVTDLSVYIDSDAGYCFAYPPRFTLQDSGEIVIRGPGHGSSTEPVYATCSMVVRPADPQYTARGESEIFLKDFTTVDIDSLTWNQVLVGGEWGWIVEPVPTLGVWRFVFLQHNGYLYRLSYWPVDMPEARADVDELTQVTVASFAFTK